MDKTMKGTAWGDYIISGITLTNEITKKNMHEDLMVTAEDSLIALKNFIRGHYTNEWLYPEDVKYAEDTSGKPIDTYNDDGSIKPEMLNLVSLAEQYVPKMVERGEQKSKGVAPNNEEIPWWDPNRKESM